MRIRFPAIATRSGSQLAAKREAGLAALAVMDRHLAGRDFFVGDRLSLADIALFAYTHVAPEGGFDLAPFGHVRAWIDRVAAQPGHVAMAE